MFIRPRISKGVFIVFSHLSRKFLAKIQMFFNFSQNRWKYCSFRGRRGAVRQILPFARNQLGSNPPRVRISPSPPKKHQSYDWCFFKSKKFFCKDYFMFVSYIYFIKLVDKLFLKSYNYSVLYYLLYIGKTFGKLAIAYIV